MSTFRMIPNDDETWDAFVERSQKLHPGFDPKKWVKEHAPRLRDQYPKKKLWTQIPEE
jgi:hypothetical protein